MLKTKYRVSLACATSSARSIEGMIFTPSIFLLTQLHDIGHRTPCTGPAYREAFLDFSAFIYVNNTALTSSCRQIKKGGINSGRHGKFPHLPCTMSNDSCDLHLIRTNNWHSARDLNGLGRGHRPLQLLASPVWAHGSSPRTARIAPQ